MMKKLLIIVFLTCFSLPTLWSQGAEGPQLIDLEYLYQGNRINIFDLRPREQEGTFYFSDNWMEGAILYKNGKVLTDHMIRYNQKDNSIEVKSSIGILTLPGYYVKEFTMQETDKDGKVVERLRFINPAEFNGGYAFNIGFLQELYVGEELSLYSAHKAELVRPDYVPILSSGSTRSRVIKRKKRFLYDGEALVEVPRGRKRILKLLEGYCPEVRAIVKREKINVRKERGVMDCLEWCGE